MPPVQIVEILRPAEQGLSKPYLCRGDDDNFYFVKGINTTRRSQVYEWICGHLASGFGLPIAPFRLVEVDEELLVEAAPEYSEIGAGLAFGSQQVEQVEWLELALSNEVKPNIRADILVFDWWIQNLDRGKGNTNLLWKSNQKSLTVIDHNCAFDPEFASDVFFENHIFCDLKANIFDDLATRAGYDARLSAVLPMLTQACDTIPPNWFWVDPEQTVKANFDLETVKNTINRCNFGNFWNTA
jgi:hypothetical protein